MHTEVYQTLILNFKMNEVNIACKIDKGIILKGEDLPACVESSDCNSRCGYEAQATGGKDYYPDSISREKTRLHAGVSLSVSEHTDYCQPVTENTLETVRVSSRKSGFNTADVTEDVLEDQLYNSATSVITLGQSAEIGHLVDQEGNKNDIIGAVVCNKQEKGQLLKEWQYHDRPPSQQPLDWSLEQEQEAYISSDTWEFVNERNFLQAWSISNSPLLNKNIFDCLPDELVLKIFSYLSSREVCLHVAPVCKKWKQFSRDHSLWKCIDFSFNPHLPSLDFLWIIRKASMLQKLVVRGRSSITQAEVAILSESCPELREIDLGFCDDLNSAMIQCLSENCPKLYMINVEGCLKLDRRSIKYLTRCKNLTHLNFSHCVLDDSTVTYLVNNLLCIKSLNLDGIPFITDRSICCLVTKHRDQLLDLDLDGAEISDSAIQHITSCPNLRHLGISFCDCLTDISLTYIKSLTQLHSLRLRKGSDFTSQALQKFFMEAPLNSLWSLNLSECTNIDDGVVLQMAKVCGPRLRELSLSWCWFITDTGLISIVDHCSNMESLDLLGIDKIRGECLNRIPEDVPHLKFLDLRQCNQIVDSLIMDVVRCKPDLRVLNYYGEEFVLARKSSPSSADSHNP